MDSNQIIIAVTGANSGLGYGYCRRILRQLSTSPPLVPSDSFNPSAFSSLDPENPPTLTLIMACRSRSKAEEAIRNLYKEHELGLIGRRVRGEKERKGWWEGLRIVYEELDVDKVGGKGGLLDFSERIRNNYPHLNTLVLNAGMGAFTGISWKGAAYQFFTDIVGSVTEPNYLIQEAGRKSADGERGAVWGVNVLSAYILAQELHSHLAKSPTSLPIPPHVIYVSSSRASPDFLPKPNPLSDPQLLTTVESYDASKYVGDLVVSKLDEEFRARSVSGLDVNVEKKTEEEKRPVRCLVVDPGVVWTGMFGPFLPWILEMCMAMTFFLARWFGSRVHTIAPTTAAVGISYLTLTPNLYLPLPSEDGPPKFQANADRFGRGYVVTHRVKEWKRFGENAANGFVDECERVYRDWKSRPLIEAGGKKVH